MKLSLRGIGPGVITTYLVDLGGRVQESGIIAGAGWEASVTAGEPVGIGSVRLGVTEVELRGDEATLTGLREAFEKKVLRAGG